MALNACANSSPTDASRKSDQARVLQRRRTYDGSRAVRFTRLRPRLMRWNCETVACITIYISLDCSIEARHIKMTKCKFYLLGGLDPHGEVYYKIGTLSPENCSLEAAFKRGYGWCREGHSLECARITWSDLLFEHEGPVHKQFDQCILETVVDRKFVVNDRYSTKRRGGRSTELLVEDTPLSKLFATLPYSGQKKFGYKTRDIFTREQTLVFSTFRSKALSKASAFRDSAKRRRGRLRLCTGECIEPNIPKTVSLNGWDAKPRRR